MTTAVGKIRAILFLLPLAFLLSPGCADKAPTEEHAAVRGHTAAVTRPAVQNRAAEAPMDAVLPSAQESIPASPPVQAGQRPPSAGKAPAKQKAAPVARQHAQATDAPWKRMLRSAGRDADARQPEPGFTLQVPASVGDGEAFLVEFGAEGAQRLQVQWRGDSLTLGPCFGASGVCRALLPVPLDEKAPSMPLGMNVTWADGKSERFSAEISIKKRTYPVQRLTVDQKFVTPPPEVQEKIKRDRAELHAAISGRSRERHWNMPFMRPVQGEVTSLYGMRRVFNNQPRNPHRGVDFSGREGDPIAALEDGVVVLVSDHYYSGNLVVIDHGLGVFSSYLHLSGSTVSAGQKVSRGDTVGFVGSTGRVTGPHLHLSLYVLGVSVNAATCIAM